MSSTDVLQLSIRIAAQPETVFRFFADPERFRQWMGEGSRFEAQQGGSLAVRYPNGDTAAGRVEAVTPNERIVFTWGYEQSAHGLAPGASRVVVELRPVDSGTLVTLTHSGLDAAQRRNHAMGWRHYLATLAISSSGDQYAALAAGVVDDYLAAWGEPDPARRSALLERCWHAGGIFRDAMGYAEGRQDLSDYITGAQHFAPGARLERTGPIRRSHGHILFAWRMAAAGGDTMMTGHNCGEFAPDGRLKSVVGFWDT